ncbi:hypothetical protein KC19_4G191700 [Ceratodon purpureus]|uniref:Uncharacterized protein n=1 Tax=Ceratodon purpureus TaxID=3225 RepID=A0A8T0IDY7_CERPU|nr:hypothetical protein KC19_4G191700 [Ceratodon purpureus]
MPGVPQVPQVPPPADSAPRARRTFRVTFSDEQMARYRALGEEAERTTVTGHIAATTPPRYEVLKDWVTDTFPDAMRDWCMLSNGYFEMKFTSSHAKDRALAGSPYDLAGAHWVTLSPWIPHPNHPRPTTITA